MPNTWFRFKQFRVDQSHSPMKVGVDGVLIGAWALDRHLAHQRSKSHGRALDVGTGTGLIALMAAQETQMEIDAVEINGGAIVDAKANFSHSPWPDRLKLFHSSFQGFIDDQPGPYELVIANPPFFHRSLKPERQGRAEARHSDSLPLGLLLSGVESILAAEGRFYLIVPADQSARLEKTCMETKLCPLYKTYVKPKPGKEPHRLMAELGREHKACKEDELIIESGGRHAYSPRYIELTRKFYP